MRHENTSKITNKNVNGIVFFINMFTTSQTLRTMTRKPTTPDTTQGIHLNNKCYICYQRPSGIHNNNDNNNNNFYKYFIQEKITSHVYRYIDIYVIKMTLIGALFTSEDTKTYT